MSTGTAQGRYAELMPDREPYLQRARECAKLTIPGLIREAGANAYTKIKTPYQSIGARGVNNLSSKLLITQLPPNAPFFRLIVDDSVFEEQQEEGFRTDVEKAMSKYERRSMQEIEASGDRVPAGEGFKHLLVTGNILLYDGPEAMRVFHLDRYVAVRDPMGNPLEIVVHESIAPAALPDDFYSKLKGQIKAANKRTPEKSVDLYTHLKREKGQWTVYQEAFGRKIPGTAGTYPIDACPWHLLRLIRIDGESYGRSYVEEYLGDLKSHEALTAAMVEGAAMAAKVIVFVDPNGVTRVRKVAEAENGKVMSGNAKDVTILHMDKHADFSVAERLSDRIEQRLAYAFLLHTAVQRNAERVTAEEIRYMAQELDTAISGIYGILSQEFQLPYIRYKLVKLEKAGKLPPLPKDLVKPTIVTGIEALGRGQDRNKLVQYIKTLADALGPEGALQLINGPEFAERLGVADGIDMEGLVVTPEQYAQTQQNQQAMGMIGQLGPNAMNLMTKAMQSGQMPNPAQGDPNVQEG